MSQVSTQNTVIQQMVQLAEQTLNAETVSSIKLFLETYYAQLDHEELESHEIKDLLGSALAHWHWSANRTPGEPKVRAYNPRIDEHAWESKHTIIEIVNDDMPFLVDSISMEVNRLGLTLNLTVHPILRTKRDKQGNRLSILPRETNDADSVLESYIHIEIDRQSDSEKLRSLEQALLAILADVRRSVTDWQPMRAKLANAIDQLRYAPYSQDITSESQAYLTWLLDNHFTMLGYREYTLEDNGNEVWLKISENSGLGLLRDEVTSEPALAKAPAQAREMMAAQQSILLFKSNKRATVHRPGYMDYVGIKRFNEQGKVIGEIRVIGLYTSKVYSTSVHEIPLVRQKIANVLQRAGFLPKSHMEKTLSSILEMYPRDELFEIHENTLFDIAMGIVRLQERQRVRLFVRRDVLNRYVSCMVFVPRDKFNTELRLRLQQILVEAFDGEQCDFTPSLSESMLARIHYLIRTPQGAKEIDVKALEQRLALATRRWEDQLTDVLLQKFGETQGVKLRDTYAQAFPVSYREEYTPANAALDIELLLQLSEENPLQINLYRPVDAPAGELRFKLYHLGKPVALSDSLPMLEHLGVRVLDERPFEVQPVGAQQAIWIHDMGLTSSAPHLDIEKIKPLFQTLFAQAWQGNVENDDFNKLVISAGLAWREIVVLRAYGKYFKQIGLPYSQSYIEQTLNNYPTIAQQLSTLFTTRFDPAFTGNRIASIETLVTQIKQALEQVANLDQDKILRQYLDTIQATLRTNFYQVASNGLPKSYISFKLNPALIPNLPDPKPMFEIWVYSPRVEGVHLRGGKVARGGLRWSDRREDFRTEILGLVKAQMVKNTVIVPVGSKGGFVQKAAPPASDREAFMKDGIECYKTFLRGLLDVTDNLKLGELVPPVNVVRHDPDDPYLVVAADKGTATFSDIANSVSAEYGFWLGDAFASGGGNGYDHKKMGITARGAWESVKRHFREQNFDTQSQDFTVTGVGDMSGDVFGNGMLLSKHIRLLAAFDHRHIFLDPNPNAATSFVERERLFNLPRSSWEDYDTKLISKGGGIYPLSAKTIPLSDEIKAVLGIDAKLTSMTPNELKTAILSAPVDLLYNGGIGTYIKASFETHAQVGDRANDAIRINGNQIRAKVLAEGGNLGATQQGRIEAAQHGVRLFTDAIDNSAGVDCSDHEVNIKILLNSLVAAGSLSLEDRNTLLAEMTDEVGHLVLEDNYYQTQCLSVSTRRGVQLLEGQGRLIRSLEQQGRLKRKIEFLPSDEQINERQQNKRGLTAPENAVLLAYSKMWLFDELVASDIPDDSFFTPLLKNYFPKALQQRYVNEMQNHPLKREIIATCIANTMTNRVGATFVYRLQEESGCTVRDIVRAYTLVRELFGLDNIWHAIDQLDLVARDQAQGQMLIDITRFVQKTTLWLLRQHKVEAPLAETIARFKPGIDSLLPNLSKLLSNDDAKYWQKLQENLQAQHVPQALAEKVATLEFAVASLDLVEVANDEASDVNTVAQVYFTLDAQLNYAWLRQQIFKLPTDTHWQTLARGALRDDLAWRQRNLTTAVLKQSQKADSIDTMLERWEQNNSVNVQRARKVLNDLQALGQADLAMLSVVLREMRI